MLRGYAGLLRGMDEAGIDDLMRPSCFENRARREESTSILAENAAPGGMRS